MKSILTAILFGILIGHAVLSQSVPFNIHIEAFNITDLGGLQSYTYGQHDGKWLIIGGRLDGLHRRQPWAAFDVAGNNNQLIVIDPVNKQKWTAPLSSLSIGLQEQLSATNMEFHQEGDYLYLIGGYGYHNASSSRKTFDNLTAVSVSDAINAIVNGTAFTAYFRQISDPKFAVTGGHLKKINNTYYLIGGNKFDGNYNPMGHASYTQVYTDAIRKFTINDNGSSISINHQVEVKDAANLHRRDYNAVPQILPNGEEGITAFSGVFQPTVNLPFLNSVTIDSSSYNVTSGFQQYYNHYHCAVLPIYSASKNEMHNVFFGGIAQYYDEAGTLVQDNEVPFVKTIARVTRDANGSMAEYKLPVEMPAFLGAGSEFIPSKNIAAYANEVIKLDEFTKDSTLVGYIYGGISSTDKNIFFTNTGQQSSASSQLFKVYVIVNDYLGTHDLNEESVNSLNIQIYPNPNNGDFTVRFSLKEIGPATISLHTLDGKIVDQTTLTNLQVGENTFSKKLNKLNKGGTFIVTIESPYEKSSCRLVIRP